MNKKLMLRLGALFVFVLLISAAVIYFTFDIRTLDYLTMFEPKCILLALGCLAVGLLFDGLRLITLADRSSPSGKLSMWCLATIFWRWLLPVPAVVP